jgi:hypothetical protein
MGIILWASCLTAVLFLATTIFRVFFHPLSSIPGPKLAALSSLYEFYFDCLLEGKFIFEIRRLHEVHGSSALQTSAIEVLT